MTSEMKNDDDLVQINRFYDSESEERHHEGKV
jgi:hypothetical protein